MLMDQKWSYSIQCDAVCDLELGLCGKKGGRTPVDRPNVFLGAIFNQELGWKN
jgi:hypothetical protein